jgi:hypothetical protein
MNHCAKMFNRVVAMFIANPGKYYSPHTWNDEPACPKSLL